MADTVTTHYNWVKPEISGSPTTWGVKLNADLDQIDAKLFAVDTQSAASAAALAVGIVPVGAIMIWPSTTVPTNYLICNGTIYNISSYPALAAVLSNTWGGDGLTTFAVPHLTGGAVPTGLAAGFVIGSQVGAAVDPGDTITYTSMNFIIRAT